MYQWLRQIYFSETLDENSSLYFVAGTQGQTLVTWKEAAPPHVQIGSSTGGQGYWLNHSFMKLHEMTREQVQGLI